MCFLLKSLVFGWNNINIDKNNGHHNKPPKDSQQFLLCKNISFYNAGSIITKILCILPTYGDPQNP